MKNKAAIVDGEGKEVWTESDQYKNVQNMLFTGFRDFDIPITASTIRPHFITGLPTLSAK